MNAEFPYFFDSDTEKKLVDRINRLEGSSQRLWGKMSVAQMLRHCTIGLKKPKPMNINPLFKFLLKLMIKNSMINEKPWAKNVRTAPQFIIKEEKNFEEEKSKLIQQLREVNQTHEVYDDLVHPIIGRLTKKEWSNLLYKHLDHHLRQFGV